MSPEQIQQELVGLRAELQGQHQAAMEAVKKDIVTQFNDELAKMRIMLKKDTMDSLTMKRSFTTLPNIGQTRGVRRLEVQDEDVPWRRSRLH